MSKENAHKTARARTTPSAPARWLERNQLLTGNCLDYGSGKRFDADYYAMDAFDPHYTDGKIRQVYDKSMVDVQSKLGQYDTITCTYVLNVIEEEADRQAVVDAIKSLLTTGGKGYISVRRDREVAEGTTSKGTWQGTVELELPVVHELKGKFCIYEVTKE